MCRTFFVLSKCTIQGEPKVDVLLIAFLYLWLKVWDGIDKYCIVPIRKLFYFRHCPKPVFFNCQTWVFKKKLQLLLHSNICNSDNTEVADWCV